jgi:hypothetical protein
MKKIARILMAHQAVKNPLQAYLLTNTLMLLKPNNDIRRKEHVSNGSDTSYQGSIL